MTATIIDGKEISRTILAQIRQEVDTLRENHDTVPGLVTILVGENPASVSYIKRKIQTAREVGFYEVQESVGADISEADLLAMVERYNRDPRVHGILVQLPLPRHIDETKILYAIDPAKDVDAFHPFNVGKLLLGGDNVHFAPCTPAAIQEIIARTGIGISGADVVVVGRSNIVGKPVANMLLQKAENANATVTVVHTGTRDIASHCKRADILIVAAGVPGLVKPEWIKPGACVIDVGVNRVGEKVSEKTGNKVAILRGDVDFEAARQIAGWITPVPGGVGPMTITMLMKNTLRSCKEHLAARHDDAVVT